MASEQFAGPIDYLVFVFDQGADLGPGLNAVLERVDQGIIEILDLEFIARDADGAAFKCSLAELQQGTDFDLSILDGIDSGILDADDLNAIVAELGENQFALAIVYEDRSLAVAAGAWARVGATELFAGGIDISDLEHALEGNPS